MWNRLLPLLALAPLALWGCNHDDQPPPPPSPPPPAPVPVVPNLPAYTVGGAVVGNTSALTLRNNGNQNTLVMSSAGSFVFSSLVSQGSNYDVVVATQPTNQTCTVIRGSGTMGIGNVSDIAITCATLGLLGGTVTGLAANGTLVLHASSDLVSGNHTITANGAFTFPFSFIPNSEYMVDVMTQPAGQTCSVANAEGDLGTVTMTNVAVTCIDSSPSSREWQTAQNIHTDTDPTDTNGMKTPIVKFDGAGNALAIWNAGELGSGAENIMWSRRPAGGQWSTPAAIPDWVATPQIPFSGSIRRNPVLAVRADGYAVAAWEDGPAYLGYHVMASTFTPGGGWTQPEYLWFKHQDLPSGAANLAISMDDQGRALLVWEGAGNLYYNRHIPGTGWKPTVQYLGHPVASVLLVSREPELAMNAAGQNLLLWRQSDPQLPSNQPFRLVTSRYDFTTDTWTSPLDIAGDDHRGNHYGISLVIDSVGTATALWSDADNGRLRIYFNRIGLNTLGTVAAVETGNTLPQGFAFDPHAVIDGNGNIVAVWQQGDTLQAHFVANRYVPGTGWGTQQNIGLYAGSSSPIFDTDFALGGNAAGHVVAVWSFSSCVLAENVPCPVDVHANEYNPVNGNWGAEEVIDKENVFEGEHEGDASTPSVAVDANGNAFAVWDQDNGGPTADGIRHARYQ